MSLFDLTGWKWWQWIRSSLFSTEEERRFIGDPGPSPMDHEFQCSEPSDQQSFHYAEQWNPMFDPIDHERHDAPSADDFGKRPWDSHDDQQDHFLHHENGHHEQEHDADGYSPHEHHHSWEADSHSDWGSSWD